MRKSKRNNDYALIETTVLDYMKKHHKTTQVEIAAVVGKSRRSIQNAITALKEKGLVVHEGARMNGNWIVK